MGGTLATRAAIGDSAAVLFGHFRNGYGMAAMTNGENGLPVLDEIAARVASAYDWDPLDKPVPR
jgi:hypothetical protein